MTGRAAKLIVVALLATMAAGCQREKEPLTLTGRIFVFNYRLATAAYLLTFSKTLPIQDGSTILARFDNPAGGVPLTTESKVFAGQDKVVLESPHVTCVKKGRAYAVTVALVGPDGTRLQTLATTVISTLDQSVLPPRPLVVGPGYAKNPEVFRNGSSVPDLSGGVACPDR